jgi:hypothetical protein
MAEAIFGLVGVAIGGILGLVGIYLQQRSMHRRWKIERQVTYLQNEREQCGKVFDAAISHVLPLIPGMDSKCVDLYKLLLFRAPQGVMEECARLSGTDEIETPEEGFAWVLRISKTMSEHLVELDRQILDLLS